MIRALWTAATGMSAQQMKTDVVANNLANSNTTGFKRSRANLSCGLCFPISVSTGRRKLLLQII